MNRQGRPILTTNLRTKIILGILAILLTCMVTIGSIFLARERKRLEEDIRSRGQALATIIAHFSATPIEKYSFYIIQEVARNVEQAPGVGFCEIYDANGDSLVHLDRQDTSRNDSAPKQNILLISQNIIRDNRLLGTVELGLELAPVEREITTYLMGLIVAGITILLLVAILISLFLSYYFISPVVQLSTVAKNIAKGNFVTSNSAGRKDEIGELAAAFNSMSLNLQQLYSTLERKVEERTADLELTNHKLQQEIRARKRTEKELHAAIDAAEQANRYKSNFVAMISHEIRTPLNAILGYTQILQSRGGVDGHQRRALEAIDRSGNHLAELINDILDLSKIEAGRIDLKPAAFDLGLLLRNMGSMFRLRCSEKRLDWQIRGLNTQKVLPVVGDAGKLRQVLINLLSNAVKFTDQGTVCLRVEQTDPSHYRFEIADSGRGIPDSVKPSIFEPFHRGSEAIQEGTGLGLAISKSYLEMMNSRLEVDDNEPTGAIFRFELFLPAARPDSLEPPDDMEKLATFVVPRPVSALLVDDDKLSLTMLSYLLNKAGVETSLARNGEEALAALETRQVDIVFMDRYMPKMDGREAARRIRKRFAEKAPPVVLITAAAFEQENRNYRQEGFDALLIKPCEINQVLRCMADLLGFTLQKQEEKDLNGGQAAKPPDLLELSPEQLVMMHRDQVALRQAAAFGRISELKRLLSHLEATNGCDGELLEQLRDLTEHYKLDEITALLDRVTSQDSGP